MTAIASTICAAVACLALVVRLPRWSVVFGLLTLQNDTRENVSGSVSYRPRSVERASSALQFKFSLSIQAKVK